MHKQRYNPIALRPQPLPERPRCRPFTRHILTLVNDFSGCVGIFRRGQEMHCNVEQLAADGAQGRSMPRLCGGVRPGLRRYLRRMHTADGRLGGGALHVGETTRKCSGVTDER
jgi:hypothetical protein